MEDEVKYRPNFKVWMEIDGKPVIGEGRAELLLKIYDTGSLSKAAETLNISYKHAHEMISSLNKRCGTEIVQTRVGGSDGGGTIITEAGMQLIQDYLDLKKDMEKVVDRYGKGN